MIQRESQVKASDYYMAESAQVMTIAESMEAVQNIEQNGLTDFYLMALNNQTTRMK